MTYDTTMANTQSGGLSPENFERAFEPGGAFESQVLARLAKEIVEAACKTKQVDPNHLKDAWIDGVDIFLRLRSGRLERVEVSALPASLFERPTGSMVEINQSPPRLWMPADDTQALPAPGKAEASAKAKRKR